MKKLLLLLSLCTTPLFAQIPPGMYAFAGGNNSTLQTDDLSAESGLGFRAGLGVNQGYNENFNFQIEISYQENNIKLNKVDDNYESDGADTWSYQSFSLGGYFNYYFIKPDEDQFYLGAQLGGAVSISPGEGGSYFQMKNDEGQGGYYPPHLLTTHAGHGGIQNQASPLLVDASVGIVGGYNKFRFELRYSKGFTNFMKNMQPSQYFDESNSYQGPELEGKLNTISFTLVYFFELG